MKQKLWWWHLSLQTSNIHLCINGTFTQMKLSFSEESVSIPAESQISRDFPWWQHPSLQTSNIQLCISGTFTQSMPWTLMQPHTITDAGFKPFSDNSLDALSHLCRSRRQFSPEAAGTWTHLTTEHVSTVFLSIWDELVSRELGRGSAQSWYVASSFRSHTCLLNEGSDEPCFY